MSDGDSPSMLLTSYSTLLPKWRVRDPLVLPERRRLCGGTLTPASRWFLCCKRRYIYCTFSAHVTISQTTSNIESDKMSVSSTQSTVTDVADGCAASGLVLKGDTILPVHQRHSGHRRGPGVGPGEGGGGQRRVLPPPRRRRSVRHEHHAAGGGVEQLLEVG